MNNFTLKQRLQLTIWAAIITLIVVIFGVRMMGKVTGFAYYERNHAVVIERINAILEHPKVHKQELYPLGEEAVMWASNVLDSVFWAEIQLFYLFGFGELVDLAETDIMRFNTEYISILGAVEQDTLSADDKAKMIEFMVWPNEKTVIFGTMLRDAAGFVKSLVIFLVLLSISTVIYLIYATLRSSIPPLEKTTEVANDIAQGNLAIDLAHPHLENSTIKMVTNLQAMIHEVNNVMSELSSAALQNSSISESTLIGVKSQLSEVELLVNSIRELSGSIDSIANASAVANQAAQESFQSVNEGTATVHKSLASIDKLSNQVASSAEAIQLIEADSESISSVVSIITAITEQTNLLALNAAIEAARAGEQGRGFAVVADEVRTLAQRTQSSTAEIQEMINQLRSNTDLAVTAMKQCQEMANLSVEDTKQVESVFDRVSDSVSNIMAMNEQIAAAAEEQNSVTSGISQNTDTINDVANSTNEGAQQTAESSEHLVSLLSRLKGSVAKFSLS
jgi:methyl-accepting chemotaxis protein